MHGIIFKSTLSLHEYQYIQVNLSHHALHHIQNDLLYLFTHCIIFKTTYFISSRIASYSKQLTLSHHALHHIQINLLYLFTHCIIFKTTYFISSRIASYSVVTGFSHKSHGEKTFMTQTGIGCFFKHLNCGIEIPELTSLSSDDDGVAAAGTFTSMSSDDDGVAAAGTFTSLSSDDDGVAAAGTFTSSSSNDNGVAVAGTCV